MLGYSADQGSLAATCVLEPLRRARMRFSRALRMLVLLAGAAGVLNGSWSSAQTGESGRVRGVDAPATAPTTAATDEVARPDRRRAEEARIERTIPLYVGESRLIDSPWPVARVSVNNPTVADIDVISPQQVQLHGISPGITDFTMWSKDEQVWRARVEVELDLRRLEGQLADVFPRSRLEVKQVGDVIVVSGQLLRAEQAVQLRSFLTASKLNFLDLTSVAGLQQVQMKVRVAEVSRTALRQLNVNMFYGGERWFGGNQLGSSASPFTQMNAGVAADAPLNSLTDNTRGSNLPFQTGEDGISVPPSAQLFAGFPNSDLEFFIQALAENTYLRVLAEPTLVAYSGEEASFLAGGEFPIPIAQLGEGGTTAISIEYREFGVRLQFKPLVLGDGTIRMTVEPEVSELSDVGAVEVLGTRVPSLLTRRVTTTFELQNGQTFALAGLINRSTNARVSRIPGIGDLPIIGSLFRSVRYGQNETELVVMVTASLVQPQSVPMEDIATPGITHRAPSSWDLYIAGKIEGDAKAELPPTQQERLKELHLDRLNGPGAWASYEKEPRDRPAERN